ncbi:MAG TPA: FKBP-type peptidyl-prolyl cis-trans isomerase [Mucilaginibacter sp.]|jgi:FKBP-type peptidyl-prolyl cis-trans isomerase|nr:FKBP-type peptidyl-prolyl cis-trans isomerase [Mucilaginibacter sp.]
MKYILVILALAFAVSAKAQNEIQHTPGGASYRLFTHNTGEKIKVNDVVTFQFIQKTDKDSVLISSYGTGNEGKTQCKPTDTLRDYVERNLMQVFPLLALHDSVEVRVPTDSIFKMIETQRPPFLPKGSSLVFVLKIDRIQSLSDAMAERDAEIAKAKADEEKVKAEEPIDAAKYIAAHKLVLKTTPSGLKYVITKTSLKTKPLKGDTIQVNYVGRNLQDKVFDTSIEAVAKAANLNQPGRTYEPIQFVVGVDNIIPGWVEGLQLVGEGGKATLVIPSALGYGAQGAGEDIKPYSTLVFDVELVKIKPIKHPVTPKPATKKPVHKKPVTHS